MTQINVYAAKAQLSRLLALAERGEEVIITRNGRPVARLVAATEKKQPRKLGTLRGRIRIGADFDAPLPDGVLQDFEGNS